MQPQKKFSFHFFFFEHLTNIFKKKTDCLRHVICYHPTLATVLSSLRAAAVQQAPRKTGESMWWRWWCVQRAHLATLHNKTHFKHTAEGGDPCRRHIWKHSNTQWEHCRRSVLLLLDCCLCSLIRKIGIVVVQGRGRPKLRTRSRMRLCLRYQTYRVIKKDTLRCFLIKIHPIWLNCFKISCIFLGCSLGSDVGVLAD